MSRWNTISVDISFISCWPWMQKQASSPHLSKSAPRNLSTTIVSGVVGFPMAGCSGRASATTGITSTSTAPKHPRSLRSKEPKQVLAPSLRGRAGVGLLPLRAGVGPPLPVAPGVCATSCMSMRPTRSSISQHQACIPMRIRTIFITSPFASMALIFRNLRPNRVTIAPSSPLTASTSSTPILLPTRLLSRCSTPSTVFPLLQERVGVRLPLS